MGYVGIDGCKGGWFAIGLESWEGDPLEDENPSFGIYKSIFEYWRNPVIPAHAIIIDIPIGIPKGKEREDTVESQARIWLRGEHNVYTYRISSVFSVPCRAAFDFLRSKFDSVTGGGPHKLDPKTRADASEINKTETGKRLSSQTFGIMPKILEFDTFLREDPCAVPQGNFLESHPELLFHRLNGDKALQYSKRKKPGFLERIKILENYYPNTQAIVKKSRNKYRKKDLADDDIVDALVCAVAAAMIGESGDKMQTIPDNPQPVDDYREKVMMAMVLPEREYLEKKYKTKF